MCNLYTLLFCQVEFLGGFVLYPLLFSVVSFLTLSSYFLGVADVSLFLSFNYMCCFFCIKNWNVSQSSQPLECRRK